MVLACAVNFVSAFLTVIGVNYFSNQVDPGKNSPTGQFLAVIASLVI